ncbi:hypothetical protein MMPV_005705 [Pyropia vietnamensis]
MSSSLWPDALRLPHLGDGPGMGGTAGGGAAVGAAASGGVGGSTHGRALSVGRGGSAGGTGGRLASGAGGGGSGGLGISELAGGGAAGDDPLLVPDVDAVFKDKLRKFEAADEAFQVLVKRLQAGEGTPPGRNPASAATAATATAAGGAAPRWTYRENMRVVLASGVQLAEHLTSFFNPPASPQQRELSLRFQEAHRSLERTWLTHLEPAFMARAVTPARSRADDTPEVREVIKRRAASFADVQRRARKVRSLARKDSSRLRDNERKLTQARHNYMLFHDDVMQRFANVERNYGAFVVPTLRATVRLSAEMAAAAAEVLGGVDALVSAPVPPRVRSRDMSPALPERRRSGHRSRGGAGVARPRPSGSGGGGGGGGGGGSDSGAGAASGGGGGVGSGGGLRNFDESSETWDDAYDFGDDDGLMSGSGVPSGGGGGGIGGVASGGGAYPSSGPPLPLSTLSPSPSMAAAAGLGERGRDNRRSSSNASSALAAAAAAFGSSVGYGSGRPFAGSGGGGGGVLGGVLVVAVVGAAAVAVVVVVVAVAVTVGMVRVATPASAARSRRPPATRTTHRLWTSWCHPSRRTAVRLRAWAASVAAAVAAAIGERALAAAPPRVCRPPFHQYCR